MSMTARSGEVAAQPSDDWLLIAERPPSAPTGMLVAGDTFDPVESFGWDCLLQALLADPAASFPASRRRYGVQLLAGALRQLRSREATVLALRYGVSLDGRAARRRSRRAVAEQLQLSTSHVAALERAGLAALRALIRRSAAAWRKAQAAQDERADICVAERVGAAAVG